MFLILLVAIAGIWTQYLLKKGSSEPLLVNDSLQCCAVAPEKQTEGTQRFVSGSVYFPLKNEIFPIVFSPFDKKMKKKNHRNLFLSDHKIKLPVFLGLAWLFA